MKFTAKNVVYLGTQKKESAKTGNPYRIATFFDPKSYDKREFFCSDEFNPAGFVEQDSVNIDVHIADRGYTSVVGIYK